MLTSILAPAQTLGAGWRVDLVGAHRTKSRKRNTHIVHSCHRLLFCPHTDHALVVAMKRSELLSRYRHSGSYRGGRERRCIFGHARRIIHAHMAENGGWSPDIIQAEAGKPLHLKLTSDDVMHGFAIGQMDMDAVDVEPGKVTDITITFDKPGIYTFYCTRWCGLNHWRMRGTIEVTGASSSPEPASAPLYVSLNLDIDAPHEAPSIPDGSSRRRVMGSSWQPIIRIVLPLEDYRYTITRRSV